MSMTKARLRDEVIVEAWRQLEAESLGAVELESVRRVLAKEFGERATPTPAAIARTLAEHGVRLRHAEFLSVDVIWRARRINELFSAGELDFASIESSIESMEKLDDLLIHFNSEGDETGQASLRELAIELKTELQLVAKARINLGLQRQIAAEVVDWLTIWLQTPHLFADWLEIRRNSKAFRQKFGLSTDSADSTDSGTRV
jgi:hypothetical protein